MSPKNQESCGTGAKPEQALWLLFLEKHKENKTAPDDDKKYWHGRWRGRGTESVSLGKLPLLGSPSPSVK